MARLELLPSGGTVYGALTSGAPIYAMKKVVVKRILYLEAGN
jgi:hypothetical protein